MAASDNLFSSMRAIAQPAAACVACVLTACMLGACGQAVRSVAPTTAEIAAAFAGSPPQLVALHTQANQLLSASPAAVQARLATLRGYPVVINKWASWCDPCRQEFPVFQQVSVSEGRRVAFLGLDSGDNDSDARSFLRRLPLSYPSYTDGNLHIGYALGAGSFYPTTMFIAPGGRLAFLHQGGYTSTAALLTDIHRYLGV